MSEDDLSGPLARLWRALAELWATMAGSSRPDPPRLPPLTEAERGRQDRVVADIAAWVEEGTPEAARSAVHALGGLERYHDGAVRGVAQLVAGVGEAELGLDLERFRRRVPESRPALDEVIHRLALHRYGLDVAEIVDGGVVAGTRDGRWLRVRGVRGERAWEVGLATGQVEVSVALPELPITWRCEVIPEDPAEAGRRLPLLHPDVRRIAATLLRQVVEFEVARGRLAVAGTRRPPSRIEGLLGLVVRLAEALASLPDEEHARLWAAYRAEDVPAWRAAFAAGLLRRPSELSDPMAEALLGDPYLPVRAAAAAALGGVDAWVEVLGAWDLDPALRDQGLRALARSGALARGALAAHRAGASLATPERSWVLRALAREPTPEVETLLVVAVEHGSLEVQRQAVAALAEVGSVDAIGPLRRVASAWTTPRLSGAASDAIEAIREREGVAAGGLSLAAAAEEAGALSEAVDRHAAGRLSPGEE